MSRGARFIAEVAPHLSRARACTIRFRNPQTRRDMATVTGTLKYANQDAAASMLVTFSPDETPQVLGSEIIAGTDVTVVLGSGGTFSVSLAEGLYTVKLDNGEEFQIDVPSGAGSHD